jgi:hypothetical protein
MRQTSVGAHPIWRVLQQHTFSPLPQNQFLFWLQANSLKAESAFAAAATPILL